MTYYKQVPVSEEVPAVKLKENHWMPYVTNIGESYWDGKGFRRGDHSRCVPEWWLKPVEVSGVPTIESALQDYVNQNNTQEECIGFIDAFDLLTPAIAELQEKNRQLEVERKTVFEYDKNLARENGEMKQQLEWEKNLPNAFRCPKCKTICTTNSEESYFMCPNDNCVDGGKTWVISHINTMAHNLELQEELASDREETNTWHTLSNQQSQTILELQEELASERKKHKEEIPKSLQECKLSDSEQKEIFSNASGILAQPMVMMFTEGKLLEKFALLLNDLINLHKEEEKRITLAFEEEYQALKIEHEKEIGKFAEWIKENVLTDNGIFVYVELTGDTNHSTKETKMDAAQLYEKFKQQNPKL